MNKQKRSAWIYTSPTELSYKRHVHYWQPNDGDLDGYGKPVGRWVYVRCVGIADRKSCYLKQNRLTPEQYVQLDQLGFILHGSQSEQLPVQPALKAAS